jgi:predicted RNA-binding Zn-ribbon protein involved in translation (DUF1610 family)
LVDTVALVSMAGVALGFLFVSLAFGSAISRINLLAFSGVALLIGALIWLAAILFSPLLSSVPFFVAYVTLYQQSAPGSLLLGSALLTAVLSLIIIIELGLLGGYGIGRHYRNSISTTKDPEREAFQRAPKFFTPAHSDYIKAQKDSSNEPVQLQNLSQTVQASSDPRLLNSPLSSDERTIAQLLLFGGVPEIKPTLSDKKPEGYFFEQLQSLDWDTQRQAATMNGLAKRGFLDATPREKILHCRSCGATALEYRGACPDCDSLALSRHKVLEHFPCGMIEKESAFRTSNGDLICPKCNKKLELIGNDYRSLGLMYVCQNCGALSKDLFPTLKCKNCGFTATPDEEKEQYLYSYTLNSSMLPKLRQYVKPIETVVNHFKSLGYIVYSPSFVRGKSGIEQSFDLMIFNSGERNNGEVTTSGLQKSKTLADILVSDKPIELEDITQEYGKIGDVNYPSMIFAVPSLSEKAGNYASAYDLRIFEGRTVEEALAKASRGLAPRNKIPSQHSQASLTQGSGTE